VTTPVNFFEPDTIACPYPSYEILRDEAPVWQDPMTGMWIVTRYDDIRAIALDTTRFRNGLPSGRDGAIRPVDPHESPERALVASRAQLLRELYAEHGIARAPNLSLRDEPDHMPLRRLFDFAFRPAAIRELDATVEELAYRLIDDFLAAGRCEWVSQLAVPLPLYVIGRQMGIPDDELPRIKYFTDAWIRRMGLMQDEEDMRRSVEIEAETRRYFQQHFDRLRREPDETLLSILVNREIPEWGRPLTDNELHTEVMSDLFVGGSETTTNALSAGVRLLIEQPDAWRRLKADPERRLEPFVEEVLRLESPVQGLLRETTVDVELHGVVIPAGSIVQLRFGAANRDERQFECPRDVKLDRKHPRRHLAFGVGTHHCLGAPLARRELYFGFKALVDRVDELWYVDGANTFAYRPSYFLRILESLHVGFRPAAAGRRTAAVRQADTIE
jgi:cytochrome P450